MNVVRLEFNERKYKDTETLRKERPNVSIGVLKTLIKFKIKYQHYGEMTRRRVSRGTLKKHQ